jgi:TonB family protein
MTWLSPHDRRDLLRWLACGAVVAFAHAGVAAALIDWSVPIEEGEVGADAIVVEFQQEQPPTDPVPEVQKPEPLPEQQSEAMLPPQPKPEEQPVPREETPPVEQRVERAVATVATWRSQIITLLEHNKRYPPKARDRDEQGLTQFGFRIDADGHLMSRRIVKSSGSATLDAETLALLERLQPYPPPPPGMVGEEQILQLNYRLR